MSRDCHLVLHTVSSKKRAEVKKIPVFERIAAKLIKVLFRCGLQKRARETADLWREILKLATVKYSLQSRRRISGSQQQICEDDIFTK